MANRLTDTADDDAGFEKVVGGGELVGPGKLKGHQVQRRG